MSIKCYETDYKNYGKCLCLDNGEIKLIATIDVGPRIVFFGFSDGENVLFEDVDRNFYEINNGYGVWYAYGGHRIWSAPEVMPETYLPDNSKVEAIFDKGTLTLTPPKTKFGKQFQMVIKMDDSNSVTIENKITNCSDKPAEFAPWSVTGLAAGGTEIVPLCREDKGFLPNRTMSLWSYSDVKDERFTLTDKYVLLRQDPKIKKAFKAGFNVTGKQILYINGRRIFRMCFDGYTKAEYPDFCCNYETYTNDLFLECELLGELKAYQPGETASIKEKWELTTTEWATDKVIEEFVSKI
ncbi:MAG: hypothetical protein K5898_15405 [Ruminococcus sp.]|uniref:hypothetical protein n=1 Tax=Ruminococcus sp. TaxID=41978 RepID=UPI0025E5822D|nr:hypothetical protein [Ruminococcus sp.]MCR4796525.1 hypothetical protein [Ruminococcus sp.]